MLLEISVGILRGSNKTLDEVPTLSHPPPTRDLRRSEFKEIIKSEDKRNILLNELVLLKRRKLEHLGIGLSGIERTK